MERLIYREEQSFRQSNIIWIMLAATLMFLIGMGVGFYNQLYLGKPYGDEPMSDKGLLWSGIISFVVLSVVFLILHSGSLVTEIWTDGIRYKFSPLIRKIKHIPVTEIASASVEKYRPVAEFGGWGWRKNFFGGKMACMVRGRIGIRVIRKKNRQVMSGTQKENEMKLAIEKMLQHSLNKQ